MRLVCVVLSLLFGVTPAFAAPACSLAELATVAETERRFSARAGEIGVRDAFLEYLSDDVVTFSDRIYVGKEQLRSQPAPTLPPRMILQWEPQVGGMACSRDLAWLTGPFSVTDRQGERPTRNGLYFSVWRKQETGEWKVALDLGVFTPAAVPNPGFKAASASSETRLEQASANDGLAQLTAAESQLAALASKGSESAAICRHAAAELRVHRQGQMPVLGKDAACRSLPATPVGFRSQGRAVSAAQDLAYTWGEYEVTPKDKPESGFYARVWQRHGRTWRIVLDVEAPRQ